MVIASNLIDEAYKKLEKNDFSGARDAYLKAVKREQPTVDTLQNIRVVYEQELMDVAREISARYSDSFDVRINEVKIAKGIHQFTYAFKLCGDLLSLFGSNSKQEFEVRLQRFTGAPKCRNFDLLKEDFRTLWMAYKENSILKKFHGLLLRTLSEISDVRAISALDGLSQEDWLPSKARRIIRAKLEELEILSEADDEA